jgi:hypothetical protein
MPKERNFAKRSKGSCVAKKDLERVMTLFLRGAYSDHRVEASRRNVASTIETALSISLETEVRKMIVDLFDKNGAMRRSLHERRQSRSTQKSKETLHRLFAVRDLRRPVGFCIAE